MSIHVQLRTVLAALEVLSPEQFRVGEEAPCHVAEFPPMPQGPGYPAHPSSDHPLVHAVQTVLYQRCYSHGFETGPPALTNSSVPPDSAVPANSAVPMSPAVPSEELIERLVSATGRAPGWENGWRVLEVQAGGQLSVIKGDSQLTVMAGDYISHAGAYTPLQAGHEVAIRMHAGSRTLQIGFFFMFGETAGDQWDEHCLVRYYLNAPEPLTPGLAAFLCERLNRLQVPFRMKALTVPQWYTRRDSVVLYVARRYHPAVSRTLWAMGNELGAKLPEAIPMFTKRLQAGVGLAEDPRTGESFGMHRCRLVAEGIVDASIAGRRGLSAVTRAVYKRFAQAGIAVDRPYLNAGSADVYEVVDAA